MGSSPRWGNFAICQKYRTTPLTQVTAFPSISAELTVIVNTQVPSVHLHHEHSLNSRDRRHHQLELQGTSHALHAELDEGRLFEVN